MKTKLSLLVPVIAGICVSSSAFAASTISGAGSSAIAPALYKWAEAYNKATGNKVNYAAIGSGGGLRQITAGDSGTVDFACSDEPKDLKWLNDHKLVQFPMVMGGIVAIFNIPGVETGKLVLDGPTLSAIFQGDIKKWNDPKIAKLNKGVKLPDLAITVVHRSDGSGTTYNFTNYLSKVSNWKPGVDSAIQWPTGLGGKGNAGIAQYVKTLPGSIGYVEYAYALQNKLTVASMKNKDGKEVTPKFETFSAAASNANWDDAAKKGYDMILTDQPGAQSWPMAMSTFCLVHYKDENGKKVSANSKSTDALNFFKWSYKNGQELAKQLDYIPIPDAVYGKIETSWPVTK